MKILIQIRILVLWICLGMKMSYGLHAAPLSSGQETLYIIGLSPFLEANAKDEVYRRIIGFLLEDLPLGASLGIYDAYHLRQITQIVVPKLSPFRSTRTRANQFKEPIRQLKVFLAHSHAKPALANLPLEETILFPQFMDFVGKNLVEGTKSVVVLVLGSPLYRDPKEPGFSMVDGYFPSDGHLIASREKSVFSIKDRAGFLRQVTVHFGYFGDPWVNALHEEKVARFWTLYLQGQGAQLATFCGDLATLFNAVPKSPTNDLIRIHNRHLVDPGQTKIEMLRITRQVGLIDWIAQNSVRMAAKEPPSTWIGPLKIGIRWKGLIDLDLYAAAQKNSEPLYFEHTRNAEGYYFKDHRSSPDREYEFIEFEKPVDVRQVQAKINFYKGDLPRGPSGEIRVEFEGRIYSGSFTIPAEHGNEGRSLGDQDRFWTEINLLELLHLRKRGSTEESANADQ